MAVGDVENVDKISSERNQLLREEVVGKRHVTPVNTISFLPEFPCFDSICAEKWHC